MRKVRVHASCRMTQKKQIRDTGKAHYGRKREGERDGVRIFGVGDRKKERERRRREKER